MLRISLLVVLLSGCYSAFEAGDPDRPRDASFDRDGGIVLPDTAPPPRPPPPPPPPPIDAGACGPNAPSAYEGARCAARTLECIRDCEAVGDEDACFDDCLFADLPCIDCLYGEAVACAVPRSSCRIEWDNFACCRETSCEDVGFFDCLNDNCFDPGIGLFDCLGPAFAGCEESQGACF